MHDVINIAQREFQAVAVAHVTDEIAEEGILLDAEALRHLELLELVAREDDQALGLVAFADRLQEMLAEGAGPAGHQHRLVVQVEPRLAEVAEGDGLWLRRFLRERDSMPHEYSPPGFGGRMVAKIALAKIKPTIKNAGRSAKNGPFSRLFYRASAGWCRPARAWKASAGRIGCLPLRDA